MNIHIFAKAAAHIRHYHTGAFCLAGVNKDNVAYIYIIGNILAFFNKFSHKFMAERHSGENSVRKSAAVIRSGVRTADTRAKNLYQNIL